MHWNKEGTCHKTSILAKWKNYVIHYGVKKSSITVH